MKKRLRLYKKFSIILILGANRAVVDSFLRLIYDRPVASRPVLDLSLNRVRHGMMDILIDAAAGLERRSWSSVVRGTKHLRYRKYL